MLGLVTPATPAKPVVPADVILLMNMCDEITIGPPISSTSTSSMTTLVSDSGFTKKDSTDDGPPALSDDAEAKSYYYIRKCSKYFQVLSST
jgi:hypothetical protein